MSRYFSTTILVVDSDQYALNHLIPFLQNQGFAGVYSCQDVEQALSIIHTTKVDIILADWNLPGPSGFDALKILRQEHYDDLKIMFMIREGESVNILEGMRAGMNGYITKPFSTRHIQRKIEALLESSKNLVPAKLSSL